MTDRVAVMIRYDTPVVPLRFRPLLAPSPVAAAEHATPREKIRKKFKTPKKNPPRKTENVPCYHASRLAVGVEASHQEGPPICKPSQSLTSVQSLTSWAACSNYGTTLIISAPVHSTMVQPTRYTSTDQPSLRPYNKHAACTSTSYSCAKFLPRSQL